MKLDKVKYALICLLTIAALSACANNVQDEDPKGITKSVAIKNANSSVVYDGVLVIDGTEVSFSDATFSSSSPDQVVLLVINGGKLTLKGCTITKSGDGTGYRAASYKRYGFNSAIVAVGEGSSVVLDKCSVTANALHSSGVFACDGASIEIKDGSSLLAMKKMSSQCSSSYGGTILSDGKTTCTD